MQVEKIYKTLLSRFWTKEQIKHFLDQIGYDYIHWARSAMYKECEKLLRRLDVSKMDALEISPAWFWENFLFKSYTTVAFPEFDICKDRLNKQFDLIIADQVFEHLLWPYRAGKNVYAMLKSGGYFLITAPFLIPVHNVPVDCTRWTETGIKYFLAECAFPIENIITGSWGNKECAMAILKKGLGVRRGWRGSIVNEPKVPIAVWALAQK